MKRMNEWARKKCYWRGKGIRRKGLGKGNDGECRTERMVNDFRKKVKKKRKIKERKKWGSEWVVNEPRGRVRKGEVKIKIIEKLNEMKKGEVKKGEVKMKKKRS